MTDASLNNLDLLRIISILNKRRLQMAKIIKEVKGLYKIIEFKTFRMTPGVTFDLLPIDMF